MQHTTDSSDTPIDFDTLSNCFVRLKTFYSPSELHGYITGLMSAGQALSEDQWLEECANLLDPEDGINEELSSILLSLCHQTDAGLRDSDLAFEPLLPDDEDELASRIDSISLWCTGFLAGFGVGKGINMITSTESEFDFPADIEETLQDFVGLSQLGSHDEEDDEGDFQEVREYVRMAAIMVFLEFNAEKDNAVNEPSPPTLH